MPDGLQSGMMLPEHLDAMQTERLDQLRRETGAGFVRVVELFLDNLAPRIEALEQAWRDGERDVLRQQAHKLKGSCATFGALRLAALCAQMEELVDVGGVSYPYAADGGTRRQGARDATVQT
ncbi:MAG: Hpt domain-containing protein, partial [Magnetococcales bacterium]|nr:Hpt domain-containing protein [Magnetococcales bacterium]